MKTYWFEDEEENLWTLKAQVNTYRSEEDDVPLGTIMMLPEGGFSAWSPFGARRTIHDSGEAREFVEDSFETFLKVLGLEQKLGRREKGEHVIEVEYESDWHYNAGDTVLVRMVVIEAASRSAGHPTMAGISPEVASKTYISSSDYTHFSKADVVGRVASAEPIRINDEVLWNTTRGKVLGFFGEGNAFAIIKLGDNPEPSLLPVYKLRKPVK